MTSLGVGNLQVGVSMSYPVTHPLDAFQQLVMNWHFKMILLGVLSCF